jgi:hypothetical protein
MSELPVSQDHAVGALAGLTARLDGPGAARTADGEVVDGRADREGGGDPPARGKRRRGRGRVRRDGGAGRVFYADGTVRANLRRGLPELLLYIMYIIGAL